MKGLEALQKLKDRDDYGMSFGLNKSQCYKDIEKELKSFEILKRVINKEGGLASYNKLKELGIVKDKQEYDLLKGVLKNEQR